MGIWLYRQRLSMDSGTGPLVLMQAEGLERAGERPWIGAERRRLKFALRSGRRIRSLPLPRARQLARDDRHLFVDHSARVPEANLVFVHNLIAAAARYLPDTPQAEEAAEEAGFFGALNSRAIVVANSGLVRDHLLQTFALDPARVRVLQPGFQAQRFHDGIRQRWRQRARSALGINDDSPLIGFISSGNLRKRGIHHLVDTATRILASRPDARFLLVGSSRLPEAVREHRLVRDRMLLYRPKSRRPERWYAALDLFLYPAVWEEFGLVVLEAMAMGLPVLTSRRVGAAECLPPEYAPWIGAAPEAEQLARQALTLLAEPALRAELTAAGLRGVQHMGARRYGDESAALILAQKR
jgi:glycosyltransferase involved in cell wall biosynthesis